METRPSNTLLINICTFNLVNEPQGPVGVCCVVLSRPDHQLVISVAAVIEEELQTLESPSGIKNPALQQSPVPLRPARCAEVHEVTLS